MAGLGAVAATLVLAALRSGLVGPVGAATLDDLVPVLAATGLLCVVGLARRQYPTAAWLATIGAAAVVTVDLATYARSVRPILDGDAWRAITIVVSLTALLGTAAAAAYAASRRRLPRTPVALTGAVGVVVLAAASIWAASNPSDVTVTTATGSALGSLGLVTRAFLVSVLLLTAFGLVGDALPAADRAGRVVATSYPSAGSGRTRRGAVAAWLQAFAAELAPGRSRARQAALAERSRLARDLHADVVPGLRHALADAELQVPPDRLAATLREVLADVEALGATQHPIQLEIGGLVPALEWLAERVESRSDVTVELEVADPVPGVEGAAPPEVAAAAFRVASLALENAARHAPGSRVAVAVRADAAAVDVTIGDDGPGLSPDALTAALANGRRGIADMTAEASACGAVVDVGSGAGGAGTAVTFAWRRS